MVAPFEAITVIHNAFRQDLKEIDEAVLQAAKAKGDMSSVIDQLKWFGEILDLHAQGEEEVVFTALEKVAPLLSPLFVDDHREMDALVEGLEKVVGAKDELVAARAAASLHTHIRIHLAKEDKHLYPILGKRIKIEEQGPIIGTMAGKVPPELMPKFVNWLFPLVDMDDTVTMTTVWKMLMPEEVFTGVKGLIKDSFTSDKWSNLTKRIPGLE